MTSAGDQFDIEKLTGVHSTCYIVRLLSSAQNVWWGTFPVCNRYPDFTTKRVSAKTMLYGL